MLAFLMTLFFLHAQAAQSLLIEGHWTQGCQLTPDDDVIEMSIDVNGDQLRVQGYGFEENGCQVPYIYYEESYSVQSFSQTTAPQTYNLNLETKEIAYTPLTEEVALALNEGSFCGVENWKMKVKTVVTGGRCNDEDLKRKDDIYFQSIRLVPDAPTSFHWGLTNHTLDGSSADKRPQNYEDLPFLKISRDFNKLM